ncbi:maltose ABC transporter periplasmic protein [Synechococcus sp. MIT S9504]|nr:maltose ABC transporter periplasmic protein [Synechococcus sp. MIT S9504]
MNQLWRDSNEIDYQNGLTNQLSIVRARLAASVLLSTLALSGCSRLGNELPVMLYLAMVIDQDSKIDTATQTDFRQRIQLIISDFRKIKPNVEVQVALYKRANLKHELQRRNASDLGPDLVVTDAPQANQLLSEGLTDELPVKSFNRYQTDQGLWERVKLDDGRITAQPMVIYPQIACFNREIVQNPPTTLQELLQQGASGTRVGLAVNFSELLWTAGSLGAIQSLAKANDDQTLTPRNTEAMVEWLAWLQRASAQQNITFFQDQGQLENLLNDGELDWVSCNSNSLLRLRKLMGDNLGVSPLPSGPAGTASPMNAVRVLALGANSSPRQRNMAVSLAQFITNPMVQRNLSLRSLAFLPVNPAVAVPVRSSRTLATLVQSREDSMLHESALAGLAHHRSIDRDGSQVLVQLVFGASNPRSSQKSLVKVLEGGA